jgi:hypothetical protein
LTLLQLAQSLRFNGIVKFNVLLIACLIPNATASRASSETGPSLRRHGKPDETPPARSDEFAGGRLCDAGRMGSNGINDRSVNHRRVRSAQQPRTESTGSPR